MRAIGPSLPIALVVNGSGSLREIKGNLRNHERIPVVRAISGLRLYRELGALTKENQPPIWMSVNVVDFNRGGGRYEPDYRKATG